MTRCVVYDYQIFVLQKYGGISRYFCELAKNFSKSSNLKARIIAPLHYNNYLLQLDSKLVSGFFVPPIRKTVRARHFVNQNITRLALNSLSPEIVHETYYSFSGLASSTSKVVITVHDFIHELFASDYPASDLTTKQKSEAIKRADCIICVSENTRNDLLKFCNVDPKKVFVTHLGCSFNTINFNWPTLEHTHSPYILYVGERQSYKNFIRLLKVYSQHKALKDNFNLICFGGPPFTKEEQNLFLSLNLSTRQIQHISGSDRTLSTLYRNASAFVYPSLYEGFGIPPLEAMAHKCPVVCSNVSSIPEVVGNAGEYFDPYSEESLAHALNHVLYSSERSQVLTQNGLERVKQFTWEKCAKKTHSIYNLLL